MADTTAFLLTPQVSFGNTDVAPSSVVDNSGFMLPLPSVLFGSTDNAPGAVVDNSGFFLPRPNVLFASGALHPAPLSTDYIGFLIRMLIRPGLDTDDSFLIGLNTNVTPSFPGDSTMTEIIYPVVPISAVNKVLTRLDSEEILVTQKSATQTVRVIDTMRFRVDTAYLGIFLADLDSNRLIQFRLATPGYTPFGGTSEDNYVRVLTRSRPQREDKGKTQLVDVTFRFMATFP